MFLRTAVALAAGCLVGGLALGQTSFSTSTTSAATGDASLDYVVTASRSREPASRTIRPVTVITAEDIRRAGAGSITELLRIQGGVEITANGGLGHASSVFIRGANSDHTVVLLDGVRIGSATSGTAAFESIPLALIERIEVLPGPSSSLYGSDAIGGVIQIFTKSAERSPGLTVAATAGSHGLRQLSGGYAARLGEGTDVAISANTLRDDGINATTPSNTTSYNPDRDGYRNIGWSARVNHQLAPGHEIGAQWLRSRSKVHFDDGPVDDGYTVVPDTYSDTLTSSLGAHWFGQVNEFWRSELQLARAKDESTDTSHYPGFYNSRQDQISWLNRLALLGGTVTLGGEWLKQDVDSSTAYTVDARTVKSGLLGWRGSFGAHALQVDLREDRNSQFGNHGTGQLGWAWQVDEAWRVRASVGSAFHAPTFNLLYYPGFGNPLLKPERSRSGELGADAKLGGADLSATWFHNRIVDLIDYAPPNYDPQNIASARIQGWTFSAAGALTSATRAKLRFTLQDPENADTGYQLRRRARQFGALQLTHQMGPVQLASDFSWVGKRFDSATESAASAMGAYGLLGVSFSWTFLPDWRLEARMSNLTDKRTTTAQGYTAPGREGQLTLRWTPAI